MRRAYYLIQRGGFWYYRLNRESGLVEKDDVTWHTTGCENRQDAENYLEDLLADGYHPDTPAKRQSFLQYAAPFFVGWDSVPAGADLSYQQCGYHRVRAEGGEDFQGKSHSRRDFLRN